MSVLVTGGAGFLGSNLVSDLLLKGKNVTVVDNLLTGTVRNLSEYFEQPRFSYFKMGVESKRFYKTFTAQGSAHFDEIYHLACPTGVPNIELLGEEMLSACADGTRNVLLVALHNRAKFVFTSSSEIYGDPEKDIQDENYTGNVHPQGPRANYEEGKRFSESLVRLYVQKYGLDAKTLRLFNVYGPKMNTSDTRVVPQFVQQALRGLPVTLHGDGLQTRTLCYAADLVEGLENVMENGEKGGIYNIGSKEEITMRELAEKIIALCESRSKILSVPGFDHDHKRRMPDLMRISSLGWRQKTSLADGLLKTIRYFQDSMESALKIPQLEYQHDMVRSRSTLPRM